MSDSLTAGAVGLVIEAYRNNNARVRLILIDPNGRLAGLKRIELRPDVSIVFDLYKLPLAAAGCPKQYWIGRSGCF